MVLLNWVHSSAVGQQSSPGKHLQSLLGFVPIDRELTVAAKANTARADLMRNMIDTTQKYD